jgi:ribonuclease P protein component
MTADSAIPLIRHGRSAPREALTRQDFQSILASRPVARTEHFALHLRVDDASTGPGSRCRRASVTVEGPSRTELSTSTEQPGIKPVDNSGESVRVGAVVPKRHARRAVTRNAIKRQIRESARRHHSALQGGTWVVRLKAPWARPIFAAATSPALRRDMRDELDLLWARTIHV